VFLAGVLITVVGMLIRIQCFRELGQLFTFDLSILPGHRLVTSGSYRYVRHPSYTGSMFIVAGLAFSHLTAGSLAVECSVLGPVGSLFLCTAWWTWTLSVGVSRAIAEDKELQKRFGSEWDAYAATTKSWFVPGLF
jgi:protein-S-isoprenylcysteine O-methyltransferase Ste14